MGFLPLRLGFYGLGLMGGSLALALRPRVAALHAYDPDPQVRALGLQRGVIDYAHARPADLLAQVDLLLLSAPVRANLRLLQQLPQLTERPLMVLDISSTKRAILAAMQALPPRFDPLGGHPMCGKETNGLAHAEADLFHGAPFAFTPLPRTSPRLKALAQDLAESLGARPLWLDADTHDRWTAAVSHLPYLLAAALTQATPPEAAALVGPGFRSSTRLAGSSPAMMLDILTTNRGPVLEALSRFRAALDELETALRQDEAALQTALERLPARRRSLYR